MRPVLFHLGGFDIPTHDFFVVLGVLVAVAVFGLEVARRGVGDRRLGWVVAGAILTGAIFARISTAWKYLAAEPDPSLFGLWLHGGKSVLGGLAGAYIGAVATKRLVGYRSHTGDLFAPAVALGMAVGRVGCFLTEQLGTPTSLPWGIEVSPATAATMPFCPQCSLGVRLHPSFAYEITFLLVLFGVLVALRHRHLPDGELFKIFLAAYATFRLLIEFVRGNPAMLGPFSGSQVFLMLTMPLLVLHFVAQARRGAYRMATA